jgi:putative ATP-dependent endonuclease of OLD family
MIPVLVIVDNDSSARIRMERDGQDPTRIADAEKATIAFNRRLLRYFGVPEEDFPSGDLGNGLFMIGQNLESMMVRDWPEWDGTRKAIVAEGSGVKGKNAATYELAARECAVRPGGQIANLLMLVQEMAQAA